MHISFLTPEYPHAITGNGGGIGTSIKNLAKALARKVDAVTVFVIGCNNDMEFYDGLVRIVCIKRKQYIIGGWYFHRKYIQNRLNHYIKKDRIEIIEAPDWTGITAFMSLACPIVIKIHGSDTYFCNLENRPQKWKNRWVESLSLKSADGIIGVSKFALEKTQQLFKLDKNIPLRVIYNGIDLSDFKPGKEINEPIILYFGTLIRKKGCLELPAIFNEVVKEIPDAQLILAGSDSPDIITGSSSTWSLMKPLFSAEALRQTNYLGKIPYDGIRSLIGDAALCVFPSYAEAFPVSWLEAMAMGKPLVTSNIGWAIESLEHGTSGYLCDPVDHSKYARSIVELINNAENRRRLGKNANDRVYRNFGIDSIADEHTYFYKKIIQE